MGAVTGGFTGAVHLLPPHTALDLFDAHTAGRSIIRPVHLLIKIDQHLQRTDAIRSLFLDALHGLEEAKEICFQVCMMDVEYTPEVCVIGSTDVLTNWSTGVVMSMLASELYQVCLIWPADIPVPGAVEYKFKKDACETWESVPNRVVIVDNGSPATQTVTHTWDDGPGICETVTVEHESWSSLKSNYR